MGIVEADISQLKKAKDWRREYAAHIFETDSIYEWFVRQHHRELVESGALIVRIGRSGNLVVTDKMNAIVPALLHKKSLTHTNQQAA